MSYSTASGGPYTFIDISGAKTDSGLLVSGPPADTTLYLIVETQTDPHSANQNTVVSEPSAGVMVKGVPIPTLEPVGVFTFAVLVLLAGLWVVRRAI